MKTDEPMGYNWAKTCMKKVFKISMILLVCSVLFAAFQGCKKDDEGGGGGGDVPSELNQLLYEGQAYAITEGALSHDGKEIGENYNIELELWWESNDGKSKNHIYFEMFSATDALTAGTYEYSNSKTAFTFDFGDFDLYKDGSYDIEREIVAGNVKVDKSDDTYTITINCKDEDGKSITGNYSGILKDNDTENISVTVNGVTFEMIAVEGGTFKMGAQNTDPSGVNYDEDAYDDESPVHEVTLSDYYIGKYEVTQAQWRAIMGDNPSFFSDYDNCPVDAISWDDIQVFLQELNELTGKKFALPTEAQWEFAARGGNNSIGNKYSGSNNIDNVGWYVDNCGDQTHLVGQKMPNELGIYDMSGNVLEWCQDWHDDYSSGSQTNPSGPSSGSDRVLRGGSWYTDARNCRVSYRIYYTPEYRNYDNGFRVVLLP